MTTANLMKISSLNSKFASQVKQTQKMQDENLQAAEAFAGLMNQASRSLNQMVDDAGASMSNKEFRVSSSQSAAESYERYSYKDNSIESASVDEPSAEQMAETAESLEQAEEDVMQAISEEYGVNEEEIQQLLEDMALNVLDLLNPNNLVNFIMQLTGAASGEELLLDASFLQVMSTMDALADGLMKNLDLDQNGLQNLISQMEAVFDETQLPEGFEQAITEDLQQVVDGVSQQTEADTVPAEQIVQTEEAIAEETIAEESVAEETIVGEADTESAAAGEVQVDKTTETADDAVEVKVEKKGVSTEATAEGVDAEPDEALVNKLLEDSDLQNLNQNTEGNSLFNQSANSENMMNVQANVTAGATGDVPQMQFNSYFSADTVQIIEQIVQQMKVTIAADTTSMEMQLNPENLGKVYVHISSEEGVVNAQFHATNEVVKEALETQIATLRENLNQAGVKVDAIEVTIASHEFERNLEQNHQNPEEPADAKGNRTGKRRNLSIDSLDELSGMMTEEEALAAQLMKDNGNSVDLTA